MRMQVVEPTRDRKRWGASSRGSQRSGSLLVNGLLTNALLTSALLATGLLAGCSGELDLDAGPLPQTIPLRGPDGGTLPVTLLAATTTGCDEVSYQVAAQGRQFELARADAGKLQQLELRESGQWIGSATFSCIDPASTPAPCSQYEQLPVPDAAPPITALEAALLNWHSVRRFDAVLQGSDSESDCLARDRG